MTELLNEHRTSDKKTIGQNKCLKNGNNNNPSFTVQCDELCLLFEF
jgi:hypothetical protein